MILITALIAFSITWVFLSQAKWIINKLKLNIPEEYLCIKCITFWSTLILTFDLPLAALAALMAYLFDNYLTQTRL